MIVKIDVTELKVGMYIEKLGVSWLKHPFARNSFLLEETQDITRIFNAGIKDIWIDQAKGATQIDDTSVEVKKQEDESPDEPNVNKVETEKESSMSIELEHARKLCSSGKEQVKAMFEDIRLGKAITPDTALPLVGEIDSLIQRNTSAMLSVARLKTHDDYTYMHSVAVCALMLSLARQLKLNDEQTRLAGIGGLMHDLGKAFMPLDILNKPGKLSESEFLSVKQHPVAGAKILKESGAEPEVIDIALHHHEKMDGKGYPDALAGEDISLLARMSAICDVYDAVTSERPYKKAWGPSVAIQRMAQWEGHFDKKLFAAFVQAVGIYPVGALVRLSSKRLAVVIEANNESLLKPKVKVFFSIISKAPIPIEIVDLAASSCRVSIDGPEDPQSWKFQSLDKLWQ